MKLATNPVDGVRVAYETYGDGPPLLLVHGSALTHGIWRAFGYVRALRDRYRLILVDLRGHGRSDKPHDESAYAIEHFVGDLRAVLDDLGIDRTHAFGYSFGARAVLSAAIEAPDRFDRLVLGGGSHRHRERVYDKLFFPNAIQVLDRQGWRGFLANWERFTLGPVDSGTRAVLSANDPAAIVAFFRAAQAMSSIPDEQLRGLRNPVLWFAGSKDPERVADSKDAAALMPDARFVLVDGHGHAGALAVSAEVLAFVEPFLAG